MTQITVLPNCSPSCRRMNPFSSKLWFFSLIVFFNSPRITISHGHNEASRLVRWNLSHLIRPISEYTILHLVIFRRGQTERSKYLLQFEHFHCQQWNYSLSLLIIGLYSCLQCHRKIMAIDYLLRRKYTKIRKYVMIILFKTFFNPKRIMTFNCEC